MNLSVPVRRALQELRDDVKDLGHTTERHHALSMFVYLIDHGESPNYEDIRVWALEQEFDEDDARDLANMPDDIIYVIGRRASGIGWGCPDAWFAEA